MRAFSIQINYIKSEVLSCARGLWLLEKADGFTQLKISCEFQKDELRN